MDNIRLSKRSNNPPWPGRIFPVSFNFAFLLIKETKKSPICEKVEIIIDNIINS